MPTIFLEIIMRSTKLAALKQNYISILRTGSMAIGLILCLCAVSLVAVSASDGGGVVTSKLEAELAGAAINGLVPSGEAETKTGAKKESAGCGAPRSLCLERS